jgi:hypothetical protein
MKNLKVETTFKQEIILSLMLFIMLSGDKGLKLVTKLQIWSARLNRGKQLVGLNFAKINVS